MTDQKIAFYSHDNIAEILSCNDLDDAVEVGLEILLEPQMSADDVLRILPSEIEIFHYVRIYPDMETDCQRLAEIAVEAVLYDLDEGYGNPEDGPMSPTGSMLAAAMMLIQIIFSEYTPWACEQTGSEIVQVREWVEKNRSDWLEEEAPK